MIEKVDAHHHLWNHNEAEFGWISDEMKILKRNFTVADLEAEQSKAGVKGSVVVQARQTIAETDWLLSIARKNQLILGVVGWLPICSSWFPTLLQNYRLQPPLKGLRHVIQDEADPNFILSAEFNRGMRALKGSGLTYDILIRESQLPQTILFATQHPGQVFVVDHLAKPAINATPTLSWRRSIRQLAELPNVYCKLSGLVTEGDCAGWSLSTLRPYLDVALEAFGAERLMAGSDWPVCLLASSYQRWWETLDEWSAPFTSSEKEQIFRQTATTVYRLGSAEYGGH